MPRLPLNHKRLIRIGKALAKDIANWEEGISIAADSGLTIKEIQLKVAADRWKLAAEQRRVGNQLLRLTNPPYRAVISRFYYAMYHSMRAVAYVSHNGDDHQEHTKLHLNIPDDFPNRTNYQTFLKNGRLARNAADYDPYPKSARSWEPQAQAIKMDADDVLAQTRIYLRKKGCTGL